MIAALSDSKGLPDNCSLLKLTTRANDDSSIALLDAWATVSDVLSFYQERIANEGFLRTATERRSILELARSVGYELRPGLAACTHLAFTIEDAPGAIDKTEIDVGTKVQSLPIQGKNPPEIPQMYETTEAIVALPELNNLEPKLTKLQISDEVLNDQNALDNLNCLVFEGTDTQLKVGDGILIAATETDLTSKMPHIRPLRFKIVANVKVDNIHSKTTVTLRREKGVIEDYADIKTVGAFAVSSVSNEGTYELLRTSQIGQALLDELFSGKVGMQQLYASVVERGWTTRDFMKAANSVTKAAPHVTSVKVYGFRVKAGFFGNNAPLYDALPWVTNPSQNPNNPYPYSWEDRGINTDSQGKPYNHGRSVYLENVYPKIVPGDWVVLTSGSRRSVFIVSDAVEESLADFMVTAKCTRLSLNAGGSPYILPYILPFELIPDHEDHSHLIHGPPIEIPVQGRGFPPEVFVAFKLDDKEVLEKMPESARELKTAKIKTDANGAFSYSIPVDATLESGEHTVEANVGNGLIIVKGTCFVSKSEAISCSPNVVEPSKVVEIKGTGFFEAKKVSVFLNGEKIPVAEDKPTDKGELPEGLTFKVPEGLFSGGHLVKAVDEKGNVLAMTTLGIDAPASPLQTFKLRSTMAYAQSEELTLADVFNADSVKEDSIVLDRLVDALEVGKPIAVTGELSNQPGTVASEVVALIGVEISKSDPVTRISFTKLANSYVPKTITINANVAAATNGETKNEVLGSGDPSNAHLEFTLRQKPLTYVSAATPEGASSTLELRVDGILWNEARSLYGVNPKENAYVNRLDDDGQTRILFGDARPNIGVENITAKYRVGIGTAGKVQAGQLSLLMTRPLGVRSVTNPEESTGAADPETADQARKNAPLRVLTLDRAVSVEDCENFALAYAGIGKAKAVFASSGESKWVRLIVGGSDGEPVAFGKDTLGAALVEAIKNYSDPMMQVKLESFSKKLFSVKGTVWIAPDRIQDAVKQAIVEALQTEFSFEARQFGQGVARSEVIAVIQRVDGVVGVDLDFLYLSVVDESYNDNLECDLSELLLLDRDPGGTTLKMEAAQA
jgi:hypothetical protein